MGGVRRLWMTWSATVLVVSAITAGACTEQRIDESLGSPAPSDRSGAPPTSAPGADFVAAVASVDTSTLRLGAPFNTQFLRVQFLAAGLDAAEAACAADRVAASVGPDFGDRPVSEVMSGIGITPDVMLPCVPIARMSQLAAAGGGADLARVPPDLLRSTLTELASAGFEEAGLTAVEATCLAERVVGGADVDELADLGATFSLSVDRAAAELRACVSPERANQLGG